MVVVVDVVLRCTQYYPENVFLWWSLCLPAVTPVISCNLPFSKGWTTAFTTAAARPFISPSLMGKINDCRKSARVKPQVCLSYSWILVLKSTQYGWICFNIQILTFGQLFLIFKYLKEMTSCHLRTFIASLSLFGSFAPGQAHLQPHQASVFRKSTVPYLLSIRGCADKFSN